MSTHIKTWQIVEGNLQLVETSLAEQNRRETEHLETWVASEPTILGDDIAIIGRQVKTQSGPLDLLGIDKNGNVVIVELKRDRLPREALAQAIDYSSDVATWSVERLSEACVKYSGKSLDDLLAETFDDVDLESLAINEAQRILLVGFGAESSLIRMIEWLSGTYDININALVLHYVRTSKGDELLTRTSIISEEEQKERGKRQKFKIEMSDDPGEYERDDLRNLLAKYLTSGLWSALRIRELLLPAAIANGRITRAKLVQEFLRVGAAHDEAGAGRFVSLISSQLGMKKNDYLRQVIGYEYPDHYWQKDNYFVREEYKELVQGILDEVAVGAENIALS